MAQGPSENPKKIEREQKQQEIVKAWDALDKKEKDLQAKVDHLNKISRGPEEDSALEKINEEIKEIQKQTVALEVLWKKEFKFPFNLFRNIENPIQKYQTEQLLKPGDTSTKMKLAHLREDFFNFYEQNDTPAFAAQRLLDDSLLPSDLKGGSKAIQAVTAVFPKPIAEGFAQRLATPGSANYESATQELSAFADLIQPAYNELVKLKAAAEKLEEGVVVGRMGKMLKEVGKNKMALGGLGIGALFLAIGAYKGWGMLSEGKKTGLMWILGGLGAVTGISIALDKGGDKNLGIVDRVESWLGMRTDEVFTPENLDNVRHLFEGMPTEDTNAIDDFIRIVDAPVESVTDLFDTALRDHKDEVDSRRLLAGGDISSSSFKAIDNGSLYTALKWFFLECYERGLKNGEVSQGAGEEEQLKLGLEWARKNFRGHKMGTAVISMEVVRASDTLKSSASLPESVIGDEHLILLSQQVPALSQALKSTKKAGVYLINGYPVTYDYTDLKSHVFKDGLDPSRPSVTIDVTLEGDDLESKVAKLIASGDSRAKDILSAAPYSLARNTLKYNSAGFWEINPPEERLPHQGLPNYKRDIPVPLMFFSEGEAFRMDMDANHDKKPDGRAIPYTTIQEVKEEFEKPMLKGLVLGDLKHVFLGTDFRVLKFENDPATPSETSITIEYGGNHKGKVVYENDALKAAQLDADAALEGAWRTQAETKVVDFFKREDVQRELLKVTGAFTENTFGGWMKTIGEFFKDGYQWLTDDQIEAKFHDAQEAQVIKTMRDKQKTMVDGYMTTLFGYSGAASTFTAKTAVDFERSEKGFFDAELVAIKTGVRAPVTREKEADFTLEKGEPMNMVNTEGRKAVVEALAPLRDEMPGIAASLFLGLGRQAANALTRDQAREEFYDRRVEAWMYTLADNVQAFGLTPTRDAVQTGIDTVRHAAQQEALLYWDTDDQDASERLMLKDLDGTNAADWKDASKYVASYLYNNLKFENYGFLPNTENMREIMALWYVGIDRGSKAVNPGKPSMDYANYFIQEVWLRMGGKQDYSPDRLYGVVWSVSDTKYREAITALRGDILDYDTWIVRPRTLPVPPELTPSPVLAAQRAREKAEAEAEKMRELQTKAREKFMDWFDDEADVSAWAKFGEGKWATMYRSHVESRLSMITSTATTSADLKAQVFRFGEFVAVEKAFYSLLIDSKVDPAQLELIFYTIKPTFDADWNTTPPLAPLTAMDYGNHLWTKFQADFPTMTQKKGLLEGIDLADLTAKINALQALWNAIAGADGQLWKGWLPF